MKEALAKIGGIDKVRNWEWSRDMVPDNSTFGFNKPGRFEWLTVELKEGKIFKFQRDTFTGNVIFFDED